MRNLVYAGHLTGDKTKGKSHVVGQVISLSGKRKIGGINPDLHNHPLPQ
jgi:hypothetical protein